MVYRVQVVLLLKRDKETVTMQTLDLFSLIWEEASMPGDLGDSIIVTILTTGDSSNYSVYTVVSLLLATG